MLMHTVTTHLVLYLLWNMAGKRNEATLWLKQTKEDCKYKVSLYRNIKAHNMHTFPVKGNLKKNYFKIQHLKAELFPIILKK